MTVAKAVEPGFRRQWPIQMNVGPYAADQIGALQIVDGILAAGDSDGQIVIQCVVPDAELAVP